MESNKNNGNEYTGLTFMLNDGRIVRVVRGGYGMLTVAMPNGQWISGPIWWFRQ